MAGGGSAKSNIKGVRIVVAGDKGTGKSSLIVTAAAKTFPANVPPVLPPTGLPDDMYPEKVPVTTIDTALELQHSGLEARVLRLEKIMEAYKAVKVLRKSKKNGKATPASKSRIPQMVASTLGLGQKYDATVDIPLDSMNDPKKKEKELAAWDADLKRRKRDIKRREDTVAGDDRFDDTALELQHSGLEARLLRLEKIMDAYKAAKFAAKS